jgi:hypothetical protein
MSFQNQASNLSESCGENKRDLNDPSAGKVPAYLPVFFFKHKR